MPHDVNISEGVARTLEYAYDDFSIYRLGKALNRPGTPLFKNMTINLESGKKIVLNASNNSKSNRYINSVSFNGKLYNNNWLDHAELLKGSVVNFNMSAQPNKQRGTQPANFPYSLSNQKYNSNELQYFFYRLKIISPLYFLYRNKIYRHKRSIVIFMAKFEQSHKKS